VRPVLTLEHYSHVSRAAVNRSGPGRTNQRRLLADGRPDRWRSPSAHLNHASDNEHVAACTPARCGAFHLGFSADGLRRLVAVDAITPDALSGASWHAGDRSRGLPQWPRQRLSQVLVEPVVARHLERAGRCQRSACACAHFDAASQVPAREPWLSCLAWRLPAARLVDSARVRVAHGPPLGYLAVLAHSQAAKPERHASSGRIGHESLF
jgi:hypothetical protein